MAAVEAARLRERTDVTPLLFVNARMGRGPPPEAGRALGLDYLEATARALGARRRSAVDEISAPRVRISLRSGHPR